MGTDFVEVVSGLITKYNLPSTSLLPALAEMHAVLGTFEKVIKESSVSITPSALPGPLQEESTETAEPFPLPHMIILGINHLLY